MQSPRAQKAIYVVHSFWGHVGVHFGCVYIIYIINIYIYTIYIYPMIYLGHSRLCNFFFVAGACCLVGGEGVRGYAVSVIYHICMRYIYLQTYIYMYTQSCICIYIYTHICIYISVCLHMYAYVIYIYINIRYKYIMVNIYMIFKHKMYLYNK